MNKNIVIVLGVIFLVGAWFLASPFFIDETVDESFDFVTADRVTSNDMPTDAPQVIARGEFVDADAVHKGSGQATVYALSDGQQVVRFEDFRTTNGPALVVYLAKHPSPTKADHVSDGGYLSLGKLKGNVGNQNYVVPPGTDITEFNSVVIWCELFGMLFSPAALTYL